MVPAEPAAIAQKIDLLFESKALAEALGTRGFEIITALEIGWDKVVRKLLS